VEAPTANVSTDVSDLSHMLDAAAPGVDAVAEDLIADVIAGDVSDAIAPDATANNTVAANTIGADTIDADAADIIAAVTAPGLTDEQQAILDFERRWWRQPGAKEQAIRDRFEISPTRYYQRLNALLDVPHALAYDAALVNRLRRMRSSGRRGRRLSAPPDAVG
jgi:Protein of unknown function (DUF3263)